MRIRLRLALPVAVLMLMAILSSASSAAALTDIDTLQELQDMEQNLSEDYRLIGNIDASATSTWEDNGGGGYYGFDPIGDSSTPFTGSFDGQGYTISNLYINRPDNNDIGLFGSINGTTIENFLLTSANIRGKYRVGAIIGQTTGSASTIRYVGATGQVTGSLGGVGGLVGFLARGPDDTLTQCYTDVTVTSGGHAGGIAGYVGYVVGDGTVSNSYARGSVTSGATGDVGGLVGNMANASSVDKSFSTGAVSGGSNTGGLVGKRTGTATTTDSFWDTTTSGQATSNGGQGLQTVAMKTQSTYTDNDWNFTSVWVRNDVINDGYPELRVFTTVTTGDNQILIDLFEPLENLGIDDLLEGDFWTNPTAVFTSSIGEFFFLIIIFVPVSLIYIKTESIIPASIALIVFMATFSILFSSPVRFICALFAIFGLAVAFYGVTRK